MKLLAIFILLLAPFSNAGNITDYKLKPWTAEQVRQLEIYRTTC